MTISAVRRAASLTTGVFIMVGVGSIYGISAWNADLKELLQCSQAGISTVSSMALFGTYLSWGPGVVFDMLGTSRSVVIAAVGLFALHALLYLLLAYTPESVGAWTVGWCLFGVGQVGAFCIFSSIVSNESLFGASSRGKVMAVLTSSYSCGGAVFAFIYHHAFNDDVPDYFLFLGLYLFVVCLLGWFVFIQGKSIEGKYDSGMEVVAANTEAGDAVDEGRWEDEVPDMTGLDLLKDERFWLLFVPVLVVIGAGLLVMSTLSFIVESLEGPMEQVPTMVAIFSICNTVTRLATGAISDHLIDRYPRGYCAAAASISTLLTQIVFLTIPSNALMVPVALAGVSEGVMFATFPVVIRETFGLRHFGKNYGIISLANCIGYPLFLSPLSSLVYELAATNMEDGTDKCIGSHCFRPIFLLVIVLSAISFMSCMRLIRLQRRATYQPISEKLRQGIEL